MALGAIVVFVCLVGSAGTAVAASPAAVPTFESLGLYWSPAGGSNTRTAAVRYRPAGTDSWLEALPLWFDARNSEYRGSIVHLRPGTAYEVELTLEGTETVETLHATTWSEQFPIAETVVVPANSSETLVINRRGSPDGYILYTAAPGEPGTIDVRKREKTNITVTDSSYVIIRGLTLKNAAENSIWLEGDTHDIVIEWNDISGWGRRTNEGWARSDSGIVSYWGQEDVERIIVQRNTIHHPTYDANSWAESRSDTPRVPEDGWHPIGPIAISFFDSRGNHVIRYNDIYSDEDHKYDDCIGGGTNQSPVGFPHRDSDIYGNHIEHCWDDAIESEGGNINVRIWGNYITNTFVHIAARVTQTGPLYIWRNVAGSSRRAPGGSWDDDPRGHFLKAGVVLRDDGLAGGGVEYVFHNTILQPRVTGLRFPTGASDGILGSLVNQITRNNILDTYRSSGYSIRDKEDQKPRGTAANNHFDYDVYSGQLMSQSWLEVNGIPNTPFYDPAPQFDVASGTGVFTLDPSSPGHDDGIRIPNFNDMFVGGGPDVGAHEAGTPPMQFGVGAYLNDPSPYVIIEPPTYRRRR